MTKNIDIQASGAVMMIRPVSFGFNDQTSWSNAFQQRPTTTNSINERVNNEFLGLVNILEENGIEVVLLEDVDSPSKPDAVFCNNWISFHHDGTIIFYPMMALNRRIERRADVIDVLKEKGFQINRLLDYSKFEETDKFLESTGSMVIDYVNNIIYACLSPRTDLDVLNVVAGQLNMEIETFTAVDREEKKVYHTNVVMSIGDSFCIICTESIKDVKERERIVGKLKSTQHEIIDISYDQMYAFAGNMLQVKNRSGKSFLAMSKTAFESLSPKQVDSIKKHTEVLVAPIPTIEQYGGGSVRCMLANIHLHKL